MILWPSVDLLGGKAVRLTRGEFGTETAYDADPLDAARRWVQEGARALHVVDLDGARAGEPVNFEHLERIAGAVEVPIQYGGGLRNVGAVRAAFSAGATRVLLGTAAYRDLDLLDLALAEYGDRVTVSLDAKEGMIAGEGWTETTEIPAEVAAKRLGERGVRRFVFSSIDKDGMLAGPDLEGVRRIAGALRGTFIYSGGVASLADLERLVALRQVNLAGVIVGKALYEGRFTVARGQALLGKGDHAEPRRAAGA
ncbi:MAG TPA: 1-(5-phosphoribosyl)-5-[(5-phosphoribosylamino)methylideneamino]imidazole-4-carboxamide isomerase [Solirubrobacteraceae bacterium]|nr:1-(5-phosphoribosyl)-5-[(5-phosphoribosylamino)methylideneamino]imidazole-4-carboxamide isomerase [Solirubrobacteraceae bacterium]